MRLAFCCMLMGKDELTEYVGGLMRQDGYSFEDLVDGMARVKRNLEGLSALMEKALVRIVAAAHCAAPPDGDEPAA
jgi:hypothetical protein